MTLTRMTALAGAFAALMSLPATAHEFWLEPVDYRVAEGDPIRARAINGEDFKGTEFGYSGARFDRSGIIAGSVRNKISGQPNARPAVSVPAAGPGLNIVYHQSSMMTLTYEDMFKFERFLKGKHLEATLETHRARGYAEENIREAYFRFVKALVAVGDGAGQDEALGMAVELVALENPYTTGGDIPVVLLSRGEPVPNAYVYVFQRAGNGKPVSKIELWTDARGVVTVPRGQGGEFMVNAVEIAETSDQIREASKAEWMTLWASLTFEVPSRTGG